MEFLNRIESYLSNNDFSIELLNLCKQQFQCGIFTDEDQKKFEKMMIDKVKECLPELPEKAGRIFAQLCIAGGVLEIKDILFIDGALFVEEEDNYPKQNVSQIRFIGSFNNYEYGEIDEFLYIYINDSIVKNAVNEFIRNLSKIFKEYFNNHLFLDSFNCNDGIYQFYYVPFAINRSGKEIFEAFKENRKINFNIVSPIYGTTNCGLVELSYSKDNKEALKILNYKKDNVIRLSNIIENNNKKLVKTIK